MRYFVYVIALLFFNIYAAYAQDAADSSLEDMVNKAAGQAEDELRLNTFGFPENIISVLGGAKTQNDVSYSMVDFPECRSEKLLEKVQETVKENLLSKKAGNIYKYRRQHLIYKNIGNFKDKDVKSFVPNENYETADRLISLKINENMSDSDFKLCRGNNPVSDREIYVLMYRERDMIRGEILNFAPKKPLIFYMSGKK